MQKDIVYIDVEDDITAIIGRVKNAKHKIIALVPPKHIGILQSAVNLRLLARAAEQHNKRIVLITNNRALTNLAAAATIPVAKNLQSKPEIPQIAALDVDDGEDVIDGADLPVGDHAAQARQDAPQQSSIKQKVAAAPVIGKLAAHGEPDAKAAPPADGETPKVKTRRGSKVPNFNLFRKKLFLIGGGSVLLIVFLVWALVFAPHATVILSARTSDVPINQRVTLSPSSETSVKKTVIQAESQTIQQDVKQAFDATGKKDVGEKASGTVSFYCDSFSSLVRGVSISAGTKLKSSSGKIFVTSSKVSLSVTSNGSGSTSVTAAERGASSNGASGSLKGSGLPSCVSAKLEDPTSGGTDKTITVVTQGDIDKARAAAEKQLNEKAAAAALREKFGDEYIIIKQTLRTDLSSVKSSIGAGGEASNGKAAIEGTAEYTMLALQKSTLDDYLSQIVRERIDESDQQRVYESGAESVSFTNVDTSERGAQVTLSTNGKIGPKVEEEQIKKIAAGKRYGDVQSELEAINGIESVDVKFSPFWVRAVPNDPNKITIQFTVDG
ncbi:hypothetical protein CR983_02520 [Candidatus Saccharibacteria bacterium]|nr:MAG: hypothetical protein CR983_02520 [Candidatus Saccharibacteria bacterium]